MEHSKSRKTKIARRLWIAFYFAWLRVGMTGFFILIAVTITAGVRNS